MSDAGGGILDRVAVMELVEIVRRWLSPQEWALLWASAEGWTCAEIAARQGLTIENLKSRLHRIRAHVRARLGSFGGAALAA